MNKLYVVPTPIGNKLDISYRAKLILQSVETILCEDTRHSKLFLNELGVKAKLISLHKFNEREKIEKIYEILKQEDVALISDAGTPTISDPGQIIINELKKDVEIIPLPGPNAITTALSASGFIFDSFTFIGFMPRKEKQIIDIINKFKNSNLIISYESSKRINQTLKFILKNFGDINVSIARELTKIFEKIKTDKISKLIDDVFKGEIVLIINMKDIKEVKEDLWKLISDLKEENLSSKTIVSLLMKFTSFKKNEIYEKLKKNK